MAERKKPYNNGKKSDLPIVHEMIRLDNVKFQIHTSGEEMN